MTETAENNNGSSEFFDKIKNNLSDLWDKIKNGFNDILAKLGLQKDKEIKETTEQTQKELNELENEILKVDSNKLQDKKIEEKIEGSIIGRLMKNNEDIKNWFNRLLEKNNSGEYIINDEEVRSGEIEEILVLLKEKADSDSNNQGDLELNELKEIGDKSKKKMELCKQVLEDDKVKGKKSKQDVLTAYNIVLQEQEGDLSKVTKDLIIGKLDISE